MTKECSETETKKYVKPSYGDYMMIPAPENRKRHKISVIAYGIYEGDT